MHVLILRSSSDAASAAARLVARAVTTTPRIVLGLPTGRTVIPVYAELARLHARGHADFRKATSFNLDEFSGLPAGHAGSYRAFMAKHLFDRVNLPRGAAHFPDSARDAERYDAAIAAAGGLDLCLVGIGANGHLGFNEPAAALTSGTHRVRLQLATRRANAYLFGGQTSAVPRAAVSMGIGTILRARAVVLLATGPDKARIVRRALAGPVTTRVPASLLQTHPNAIVILDRAAARELRRG